VSYRVDIAGSGLVSTTPVVLVTSALLQGFPSGWVYATNAASVFTFFDGGGHSLGTQTLTIDTLAGSIVSEQVLISVAGQWKLGVVLNDGSTFLVATPTGQVKLTSSARSAFPLSGYPPPYTPRYVGQQPDQQASLLGVSADGHAQFSGYGGTFIATALSTLGATSPGTLCAVETVSGAGPWIVITV
jgi:hypothetical protein